MIWHKPIILNGGKRTVSSRKTGATQWNPVKRANRLGRWLSVCRASTWTWVHIPRAHITAVWALPVYTHNSASMTEREDQHIPELMVNSSCSKSYSSSKNKVEGNKGHRPLASICIYTNSGTQRHTTYTKKTHTHRTKALFCVAMVAHDCILALGRQRQKDQT